MVKVNQIDPAAFEPLVIYKCLQDSAYMGTIINYLKPEYFSNQNIKDIIGIITGFYEKHNTVPTHTEIKTYLSSDELKQAWKNVVGSFEAIDKNLNQKELYENTEKFLQQKAIEKAMIEIVDKFDKKGIDTSEIMDKFQQACSISLVNDMGIDYLNSVDRISHELNKLENYISSGYAWIDERLGGGFLQQGKALYVFSGQTNVGKSIVLGNIASNICAQGKTVILITLEMSEIIYAKRLCGNFTNIPCLSIRHRLEEFRDEIDRYKRDNPKSRLIIKEFPTGVLTVSNLSAYIKKLIQTGIKPDAVVVDYVNLLTTSFGNNSYEKIKHITENLRALSYIYNVPVITATQLNRTGMNQSNPGLETLSESMGLGMTADCVIGLWREKEDEELGRIRMNIQKNRQGPNFGKACFAIDFSTMRMREDSQTNTPNIVNEVENSLSDVMD